MSQTTNSQAYRLTNTQTHKLINLQALKHPTLSTHKHTNLKLISSTQKLTNSKTHQLKNSPTQKLKFLYFILQSPSNFRSVLAKIQVKKQVNSHNFQTFTSSDMSVFKKKPAFCTILPFQFDCNLVIFQVQLPAFSPQKPTF